MPIRKSFTRSPLSLAAFWQLSQPACHTVSMMHSGSPARCLSAWFIFSRSVPFRGAPPDFTTTVPRAEAGGANQACVEMLEKIRADGGNVKKYIDMAKDKN